MLGKLLFGGDGENKQAAAAPAAGKESVLLATPTPAAVSGSHKRLPATGIVQLVSSSAQRPGGAGKVTKYFLVVASAGVRVELTEAMELDPPCEQVLGELPPLAPLTGGGGGRGDNAREYHLTLSQVSAASKQWVTLKLPSTKALQAWHKALRDCLASLVFSSALVLDLHNRISLSKVEVALKRCEGLVPPTHKVIIRTRLTD